ncbi:5938_t:CDS:2 [Dentiscutata erythropus]|uniref:5938_t:CDS:1 n=1 Tax=Dentiscutata erythropus TaxID=1348616 RepID=A0A9N9H2I5_9GLOM|nr:5938_t:CDS:2 [Dentiscutata erythropus]
MLFYLDYCGFFSHAFVIAWWHHVVILLKSLLVVLWRCYFWYYMNLIAWRHTNNLRPEDGKPPDYAHCRNFSCIRKKMHD